MNAQRHASPFPAFRGIATVTACYIYFLIFAQFAFLRLVEGDGLATLQIRYVMGAMAVAGVVASLGMARFLTAANVRHLLLTGFGLCGVAACLALSLGGLEARCGTAALIGLGLGMTTVGLAASTPHLFPAASRGIQIGIATGLAYAICNVPGVFAGTPFLQSLIAFGACAGGALAVAGNPRLTPSQSREEEPSNACLNPLPFISLLTLFLALVWLDSAAFYILQSTPELNQFGWATASLQWSNSAIHLVAACAAGFWLDRGRISFLLLTAFACLALAATLVSLPPTFVTGGVHWLYATGVSLYSTALVFAPAQGRNLSFNKVALRAGILFAVAGWSGSALGIGMAQDLHRIPLWFLGLSGSLIACSLLYPKRRS